MAGAKARIAPINLTHNLTRLVFWKMRLV